MDIFEAVEKSRSMAEAARLLDMPFSSFKRKAQDLGLYSPNQSGKGIPNKFVNNGRGGKIPLEEIIEGLHPQYPTNKLKLRLWEEQFFEKECEHCGVTDIWEGKSLVLQLDHINGINNDHRLENLRILCPNCHSQTDTWCGRNKK